MKRRKRSNGPRWPKSQHWQATWTSYRYPASRPVSLAATKVRPILTVAKHNQLVDRAMDILGEWRLSPFEHEEPVRHGLRIGLCLEGNGWGRADLEAASIVDDALRKLGAARPTFAQGQREYTVSSDYCAWCHCPIEEESRFGSRRFCSADHARAALAHRAMTLQRYDQAALSNAYRLIAKEEAPPRQCGHCGKSFKSEIRNARFCSLRCNGDALRQLPDKQCETLWRDVSPAKGRATLVLEDMPTSRDTPGGTRPSRRRDETMRVLRLYLHAHNGEEHILLQKMQEHPAGGGLPVAARPGQEDISARLRLRVQGGGLIVPIPRVVATWTSSAPSRHP
jgi:hypothetical protein